MAHKKGVGSSKNGRESESKRLGVKIFGGQLAKAGNIILRQRGTKHRPGENVYIGKDHTVHAKIDGIVISGSGSFTFSGNPFKDKPGTSFVNNNATPFPMSMVLPPPIATIESAPAAL